MSYVTKIEIGSTVNDVQRSPVSSKAVPWLRRWAFPLSVLALAIGAKIAVYGDDWWNNGRYLESTDDARVVGQVTAIVPKISGYIAQVAIVDGQVVHAGDLLLKLDDRDFRVALEKADAVLEFDEMTLSNLDSSQKIHEAMAAQAQAQIIAAEAETVRLRNEEKPRQALQPALSSALRRLQRFQEKSSADARATLVRENHELEATGEQKRRVEGELTGVIAERESAKLNLGYTEIRAPYNGLTGDRKVGVGAYVAAGSQLISLTPENGIWVSANFRKSEIARIHVGSPATIKVGALPGQVFRGHVVSIAPVSKTGLTIPSRENTSESFANISHRIATRIVLDAGDANLLWPGLSAQVTVNTHSEMESTQ